MDKRYDFVLLFDVADGNPNGDPDAGNLPRIDPETGHGLVTDVCLKRKVRNYVGVAKAETPPYEIYVKERAVLNAQHERAYKSLGLTPLPKKLPKAQEDAYKVTKWMCDNFFDVRTFGAVMSTEINCGQVRGPVQLTFARSVDPVITLEHALTVCAARKADKSIEEQTGIQGRKFTVPYGLYRCHGFVNPFLASNIEPETNAERGTGFSNDDLQLFWQALKQMFELDRSAARGQMATRKLVVFAHDSKLGNAPAHELQQRVRIERADPSAPARGISDYRITIDEANLPAGITVQVLA